MQMGQIHFKQFCLVTWIIMS